MKEKALQVFLVEGSMGQGNRVSQYQCPIRLKRNYKRRANCYLGKPIHFDTLNNFADNTRPWWQTKGRLRPQGRRR
jgi:hypothetical protein